MLRPLFCWTDDYTSMSSAGASATCSIHRVSIHRTVVVG